MSTPAHRANARDFWNLPSTAKACQVLDYSLGVLATVLVLVIGSLN